MNISVRNAVVLLFLLVSAAARGQLLNPVHFQSELKTTEGSSDGEIIFSATIDDGWHVYSTDLGQDGPIPATFHVVMMEGVKPVGKLAPKGNVIKKYDELFGMELKYFEHTATFVQKVRFTKPEYTIDCYLEYGACNDQSCMPPTEVTFKQTGKSPVTEVKAKAEIETKTITETETEAETETKTGTKTGTPESADSSLFTLHSSLNNDEALWSPVVSDLKAMGGSDSITDHTLLYIFLMGFVGGLLAVCMPCIWPIIPMTVSFFLKRSKDKRKGIRDAFIYGVSIIIIYLGLGLLVTALFGSDTLNAMSTNAVFNIFLFVLLVVFALSLFGWFDIKLPDSWATHIDVKADKLSTKAAANSSLFTLHSSLFSSLSIFLMAFTLVLVSFSCTAPIVGLLLVETATSGNWLAPAIGMFGFALALALPFTLFALFPAWLKQAPKSGSWMNTIKVVLGFIELAFSLKFFSVADQAYGWHLLSRDVFLLLWIIIFALLGAYLCGWLKMGTDTHPSFKGRARSWLSIMGGLASLAFAVYMVPGLWGAPCKAVSAFAPPMSTQHFNLYGQTVEAHYTDYEAGMAAARSQGKPVLIDFTGYGCVNCRKMEAAVWTDPHVADKLKNDFVLISLYVDDKTPLSVPVEVKDADGHTKTLRTVGAKWSYLQSHKFGANAQPFYVIVDPATGKPLTGSRGYDEDIDGYLDFLEKGLNKYKQIE